MRKYIIKSYEDYIGEAIYTVLTPDNVAEKDVFKNFKKASKYATCSFENDPDPNDYDEHFDEMLKCWEEGFFDNGEEAFFYYLETFHGYEIDGMHIDFEFEW